MYSFANDYSEGACPKVLDSLIKTNRIQTPGYGLDDYCNKAISIIKDKVGNDNVDVHFIPGGTPCNLLAISLLRPFEAVIAVESGHINVHETGAIEGSGHKILTAKGVDGKITPEEIKQIYLNHSDEHMVKPKMVFISNSTELGTIYYKNELKEIYNICKELGLYLYLDGARIGNALTAVGNDMVLKDICRYTDMFYIGGTKNGALFGEAMIIKNDNLKPDFRYLLKNKGAMMAKSRLMGVQFISLLEDDTYLQNAKNANIMAQALKYIFTQVGINLYIDTPTNQIFPIIENSLLKKIENDYIVTPWGKYDEDHTIVRFACSWACDKEHIQDFYNDLDRYMTGK